MKVSDAGLAHLAKCKNLKRLSLGGNQFTEEAVERLKKALPECKVDTTAP
jgi:hypothetical protein